MEKKITTSGVDPTTHSDDAASVEAGIFVATEYAGEQPSGSANQLHRTFTSRHIQMIGLAGSIGSGLFIGTGKALRYGNYPGMFLGWTLICTQQWMQMQVMSEACVIFPTSGAFIDHAARFLDPALAFALGACEWFAWHTTLAAEGAVFRLILTYWTTEIPTAACMTFYLAVVFAIHCLPNRWFAEVEFGTAVLKMFMMFIIIITCIVMLAGGGPTGTTHHAENYTDLPAFPNGFKGIAQCFLLASFSCGGNELLGITNGEAKMPRWNMPRAINNLAARLFFFFGVSVVFISLLVPYTDERLLGPSNIAASPFVIAMSDAGIKGLPDLLNVVIIIGLCAIGAESLYITSRLGTAMARMGLFPKSFGHVDKKGRPYVSLAFSAGLAIILTYINCSNTGGVIFTWFSSVGSTVYFIAYLVVAATNWRMRAAFKAQNDNPLMLKYAYKNKAYPLGSVFLFISGIFVLASTFYISLYPINQPMGADTFFQTFLCIPLFLTLWIGYKVICKTKWVDPAKADLQSGRRPLTAEDIAFLDAYYSQPMYKRIFSYVGL
ncbi:hypothetical protein HRR83_003040 [Exophiala dermatitidis]|uniref:AAT family amino acid transporter n=2 Tax=Exophiala dermatitidis TaxID=5970 RepID=H6BYI4_EXODN